MLSAFFLSGHNTEKVLYVPHAKPANPNPCPIITALVPGFSRVFSQVSEYANLSSTQPSLMQPSRSLVTVPDGR